MSAALVFAGLYEVVDGAANDGAVEEFLCVIVLGEDAEFEGVKVGDVVCAINMVVEEVVSRGIAVFIA